ncbi:uncharacterized protein [Venturia canescens]|uniref:uncharacterized protein isoform X2 n=1 Tax=Venturia canescens TaxID=32260 RepID=UPI001C9CD1F9|nr:uncharacterized protein LOC122414889 isoform X2 [Venturia canescens]
MPGCRSRKEGDETRRKKLGLCRITLFSIPKSKDRRNQWKKALDCELDVKQFVCQFHFSEDSIKKSDRIVLTDGTVYDSPLIRWRLNEGAVPISQQCGPMDCEENNNGIEETEQENSALDVKKEQLQISNSVVLDEGTDTAPSILTESWTEQDVDNVKGAVDAFTLGNLKDDLTAGLLSESWAWTQKSTGLIFTLLNRSNLHPQLHLEVALDLTLSIRTITDTVIPLNDQATSSNDIRRYMKILKNCIICSGTGVQSESRDPRCVGMIDLKKPGDNQRKNWRCELCQQIRERVQRRNQRRRKTILKRERAQKKADLTRRKFIRLKRKTKKLYADVADLKRSCSRIEKETLEKNIALLPEAQKQAVRTCLETAKVGNRKGRRYAIEWMYECLLMRIKNSGLYDHIRERKILPLPCRETLSRYIRRISSSAYGFQTAIFEGMKMKGLSMESNEK